MSGFHVRYVCACGSSCRPSFGSAFFAECDYPVCPDCGSSSARYERQVVREATTDGLNVVLFVGSLVLLAFVLTGCATAPTYLDRPLADRIPASLLQCADAPIAGTTERQSDVARFLVDLDAAGEDCRRKVGAINQIVQADGSRGERG